MNTTELPLRPDVAAFVARVRELLGDLSEEDRLELTEGLEADLSDQVAEQGGGVLGDPQAYVRELRTAAGFVPVARRRVSLRRGVPVADTFNQLREWWDELVSGPRLAPVWSVVVALRPGWWVLRAWVAAVVVARLVPGWYAYGFTWLPGVHPVLAVLILLACVVVSALVGLGRLWPGAAPAGARGLAARTVLVLLNIGVVCALPVINGQLDQIGWDRYSQGYNEAQGSGVGRGISNRGNEVCNISAYDAQGQPLVGVQLFDQRGQSFDVRCYDQAARMVPWVLGDVTRWNVFPLGERARPARNAARRADLTDAAFPTPDRATTPEVTNPLVPEEEAVPVQPEKNPDKGSGKGSSRKDAQTDRETQQR